MNFFIKTTLIALSLLNCTNNRKQFESRNRISTLLSLAGDKNISNRSRYAYNQKAFYLLSKSENDSIHLNQFIILNNNFKSLNKKTDLKRASFVYLKKSTRQKSKYHIGQALRGLGIYYEDVRLDSSYFYFKKAGTYLPALDDKAQNNLDKANILSSISNYDGSDYLAIKALKSFAKSKNLLGQWDALNLLGINSIGVQEFDKAVEFHKKALDLSKKNDLNLDEISLNNLGHTYATLNNHLTAIVYFQRALQEKRLIYNNPNLYATLLDNLAFSQIKINYKADNYKLFYQALKIRERSGRSSKIAYSYAHFAEFYYLKNDIPHAKLFAEKCFRLAKKTKIPDDLLIALKQLSKVDSKNALKYSQEYIRISDSMQLLERQNRNKFAKIAYETEEITTEKDEAIQQKWIFLGLAILVAAIGILLFIIINQRIKQKEMNFVQEQQKSDTEIYQLIQNQQHKIDEGREIEKKRIAQDLHDGIMNRLASTRINLHMLNEDSDRQTIQKCIPFIQGIQNIEKEIRNISHDLNKDEFSNTDSYLTILDSLFEEQKVAFKAKCHFEIDKNINWEEIESTKKIHIYRILQEALTNIRKHAKATTIIASILNRENNLLMEIYDDGIGFSLNRKKKGIGLQNIYSRAKASNGTVEIKSHKDIGTTLILTIPKRKQTKNIHQNGNTDKYSYC